ncbi:hypothetical protein P691DRAFT_811283 [Macrolepiota fuliginosa MF-IS2]|uniref:Uncharacterized protein n=1 Tax=Macrolepiota fuliginosa MF-IS2 TaxID=1400762 RepID=A0A9P6C6C1_9AGAR|nr:hypothetical protein P691DRAFT_811283 [Macrolepiota fuliginosa MF-IS2]
MEVRVVTPSECSVQWTLEGRSLSNDLLNELGIWSILCMVMAHSFSGFEKLYSSQRVKVPLFGSGHPPRLPILFAVLCVSSVNVRAAPIDHTATNELHWFHRRAISDSTWIPVVAICAFLFILLSITFWKRRAAIISTLRNRTQRGTASSGSGLTELTADQLAGGNQNAANNGANSGTTTTRPRRSRRPRRTPSQMSTHSLPAYAKEPGEQELVILQGSQDMEDVPIPQTIVATIRLDEEAEESVDEHQPSRYTPIPEANASAPLLSRDSPGGHSSYSPHGIHMRTDSADTGNGSTDTTSLIESREIEPDPRGEAPAYFEVVEQFSNGGIGSRSSLIAAGPHNTPVNPLPPTDLPPPPPPPLSPQGTSRRSGFRSLLHRMSVSGAPSHSRNDSSISAVSSAQSHSRSHTRGTSTGSILSHFRTLSRQKSITSHNSSRGNLTSPSLISLNSISAPLTHTVVRTEFTYPRSGPTPDQVRLIANRENFTRFGVPYGPDALAFASMSRVDLADGDRPPEFEEAVGTGGANVGVADGSPTRASAENVGVQGASAVDEANHGTGHSASRPTSLDGLPTEQGPSARDIDGIPATVAANGVGLEREEGKEEAIDKGKEQEAVKVEEATNSEVQRAVQEDTTCLLPTPEERGTEPETLTSVPAEVPAPPEASSEATSVSVPITPATATSLPEVLPKSESPVPTKISAPPPSSYHPPVDPYLHPQDGTPQRPESRASQMSHMSYASDMTFRTAAESLNSRRGISRAGTTRGEDDDEDDEDAEELDDDNNSGHGDGDLDTEEDHRPSTPTLGRKSTARHGREGTDATITDVTPIALPGVGSVKQKRHISTATVTRA